MYTKCKFILPRCLPIIEFAAANAADAEVPPPGYRIAFTLIFEAAELSQKMLALSSKTTIDT